MARRVCGVGGPGPSLSEAQHHFSGGGGGLRVVMQEKEDKVVQPRKRKRRCGNERLPHTSTQDVRIVHTPKHTHAIAESEGSIFYPFAPCFRGVPANPDYYRCTCEVRLPGMTQTSFGSPLLPPSPPGEYSGKNPPPRGRSVFVGRAWAVFFLTLTLCHLTVTGYGERRERRSVGTVRKSQMLTHCPCRARLWKGSR